MNFEEFVKAVDDCCEKEYTCDNCDLGLTFGDNSLYLTVCMGEIAKRAILTINSMYNIDKK